MKVLFAGGGTGGHLYPAIAVARSMRRAVPEAQCLFLGSQGGMEASILAREGFPLHAIPSSGFRRLGWRARLRFFTSLLRGFWQALALMRRFRPHLVVATGGHASLAGGLAAACTRTPLVVQEQNRIPGQASRLLGRVARRIYVGFPGAEAAFAHPERVRCLGNPIREELLQPQAALSGVPPGVPVLLVLGGSRGARSINRAVAAAIPLLRRHSPFWIWQTGALDFASMEPTWGREPDVLLRDYLDNVGAAYAAASLLVCRAGAMTLAEITALGKPAILVPFPGAVDDHQTANARTLTEAGAAILLPDQDLSGESLARELDRLLELPDQLQTMAAQSRRLGRPEATRELVADFMQIIEAPRREGIHVRSG